MYQISINRRSFWACDEPMNVMTFSIVQSEDGVSVQKDFSVSKEQPFVSLEDHDVYMDLTNEIFRSSKSGALMILAEAEDLPVSVLRWFHGRPECPIKLKAQEDGTFRPGYCTIHVFPEDVEDCVSNIREMEVALGLKPSCHAWRPTKIDGWDPRNYVKIGPNLRDFEEDEV
jgi:hypothetical protein